MPKRERRIAGKAYEVAGYILAAVSLPFAGWLVDKGFIWICLPYMAAAVMVYVGSQMQK